MAKPKLVRITTIPFSLEKLLKGQLDYMQKHFNVTAVSSEKENLETFGKEEGVATYHIEMTRQITPWADLKAVYQLYKFINKEKPTIVHTHTPKAGIVGMMAAWLARVPHRLHTVGGLPLMEATGNKRKLLDFVEKNTYNFATKIYPNSKGLFEFIVAESLAKPEKLKIIGQGSTNGINTHLFDPTHFTDVRDTLRKELNIPQESFVFVFVGRIVGDKGINELVEAFSNIQRNSQGSKDKDPKLLLVGFLETELDPLKPETLYAIENNPDIISVGYQKDVRPYFAAADALAFPSYREGFPNVVMQAGAMGLPAIVSNINGCNEIIEEGKNGLIIKVKDSTTLEQALTELLTNSSLYQKLKSNAREMITSRFSQEEVWKALLEEYNLLLKR
ncbi:glycosyltransferase family 4 protein [Arenibacter certesii]|uniref:Glycosyl transferase n=1 Tax=Arenibacter certesii TaxID=228955 RepID=A0A918MFY2_9FLAO|nr:glycosyltransferase family 4 protein [Arenibacter certesii]GGW22070.1 glycosyl transferase [Arenibacter certesii]